MSDHIEKFDLRKHLVEKSIEAYILALETINKLTIKYRLETFCHLICNAWELLLKAKILTDNDTQDSIYYKEKGNQKKKSISLRDCLKKIMPNKKDPVRRNIERIVELRDESIHLVISHIPRDVTGLLQAGVINYHKRLYEWFGTSLSDRFPIGMMSIVYDMGPEHWDMTSGRLYKQLGQDAADFLTQYCAELKKELDELNRSTEFLIGIEYRLALTKSTKDADIILSSGPTNSKPTKIIQIPKDPSKSHPFRQKELILFLQEKNLLVNSFDIQCINRVYGIKDKPEYFYQGKVAGSPGQYSQEFGDWIIKKYRHDNTFFNKVRNQDKKRG